MLSDVSDDSGAGALPQTAAGHPSPPPLPQQRLQLLTEGRFMELFLLFSHATGIRLSEQDFTIEGRQINPWVLHRAVFMQNGFDSVTANGEWPMIGAAMGFPPFGLGDPTRAQCAPTVAHQLQQLYEDSLRYFDEAYISSARVLQSRSLQTSAGQVSHQYPHQQAQSYQPMEADYRALLASITAESSFLTPDTMNILSRFSHTPGDDLRAHGVPLHVISFVEQNREHLERAAQDQTGFHATCGTPNGNLAQLNQASGVQAIAHPPLQSPLRQQQNLQALHTEIVQGATTHQQTPQCFAMLQSSPPHHFHERSFQFPPGFPPGETPSGFAQQELATLSHCHQVLANDPLQHIIQAQDPSHARQFNMLLAQGQQQNGAAFASHPGQNVNPPGMGLPQGRESFQQNFVQPFPSIHDVQSSAAASPSQVPPQGAPQVPGPSNTLADLSMSQLHNIYDQMMRGMSEVEKNLQTLHATSGSSEGDIQRQLLRSKFELYKQRLHTLREVIQMKMRANGDPAQQAANGQSWLGPGQRPTGLYTAPERPGQHNSPALHQASVSQVPPQHSTPQQNFVSAAPQSNLAQIPSHVPANGLPLNGALVQMTCAPPQQLYKIPPLSEEGFRSVFLRFTAATGTRLNERDLVIEDRPINLWTLHKAVFLRNGFKSVCTNDEWPIIGAALGFPPFPGGDADQLARCGPVVAQRLQQLYSDVLRQFDQTYIHSVITILRRSQEVLDQMPPQPPQPLAQARHYKIPPLSEERFMSAFSSFTLAAGIRPSERDLVIEGRQVNLWALHKAVFLRGRFESVCANDEWPVIGAALGFRPFSGGDAGQLARCGPAVAQRLQQLYSDFLRQFEQAYSNSIITRMRSSQLVLDQTPSQLLQPQAQPHQPTEADYRELLANIPGPLESSVMTSEVMMNILPRFSHTSGPELEAHRVPQHVIVFVEQNREHLQRQALVRTGVDPLVRPSMAQPMNGTSLSSVGEQMTGPHSSGGAQNQSGAISVPMNAAGMNSAAFGPAAGWRLTAEGLTAAKRWVDEQKRMAFSCAPNFEEIADSSTIRESDIQEYHRNLERLDQVLGNIEKYIHIAFAALKKEHMVQRMFRMMALTKAQLEELQEPNPRYILELYTIRSIIQEYDNLNKGLTVLFKLQAQNTLSGGVPSTRQSPLRPSMEIPPPFAQRAHPTSSQGDESSSFPEGVKVENLKSNWEDLFNEEVQIAMAKLRI